MALHLSAVAVLEKNKLMSDGAWLVLLEIQLQDITLRVVRNTEDVIWNNQTWVAFPFELDDVKEDSKGELPTVTVRVSNVSRAVQQYIEQANGGVGAAVILRVVHSKHLDALAPELEEVFTVQSVSADAQWVTFNMGGDTPTMLRFPARRMLKDFCPFQYKGIECRANSALPTCSKTLGDCRARGNATRFGGEPSIPQGGIYASNQ
jgi:lambda family phage minor tail protein L